MKLVQFTLNIQAAILIKIEFLTFKQAGQDYLIKSFKTDRAA
jgi:hypothetical protein